MFVRKRISDDDYVIQLAERLVKFERYRLWLLAFSAVQIGFVIWLASRVVEHLANNPIVLPQIDFMIAAIFGFKIGLLLQHAVWNAFHVCSENRTERLLIRSWQHLQRSVPTHSIGNH